MRLFIFAVGGTGARVLKSLIMLLATGIKPVDENGNPLKDVEIVPIIVDPHKANDDLKRTEDLLKTYREIYRLVYGNTPATNGFFSTKISTLREILKNTDNRLSDTFLFRLGDVDTKKFKDYIGFNELNIENQALCSLLFSTDNLETEMNIGFVGAPNIGSVALNQFKDSIEFREFANVLTKEDRVFIISSIFGGTGAAGYPIIVKNIRNADNPDAAFTNREILQNTKIGALTVLPYFNVSSERNSPITRNDFIVKTKSALYYYRDNLTGNGSLNAGYYLGDKLASNPYKNDPGKGGQKNDAHLIETIGALSVFDFMSLSDNQLQTRGGKAENPIFKEYGLANDTEKPGLLDLGKNTRRLINKELVKFHLFKLFIENKFEDCIGRGFTEDKPELKKSFLSTPFYRTLTDDFFRHYDEWLREMDNNKRSFSPFISGESDIAKCLNGIEAKKSFLKGPIKYDTILDALNDVSRKNTNYSDSKTAFKLFDLFEQISGKLIDDKYNSLI